jgi:hypothetical protein
LITPQSTPIHLDFSGRFGQTGGWQLFGFFIAGCPILFLGGDNARTRNLPPAWIVAAGVSRLKLRRWHYERTCIRCRHFPFHLVSWLLYGIAIVAAGVSPLQLSEK